MAYSFRPIYKLISPLFKHKLDIYRMVETTGTDFITNEERTLIASDVDAYVTQSIRAPYMAFNNDDTLKMSGSFNVHVKYDVDIRSGDYLEARLQEADNSQVMRGFAGRVRIGSATKRTMMNVDDTKTQL